MMRKNKQMSESYQRTEKAVELESDGDTNRWWNTRNNPEDPKKEIEWTGD